ncbi:MAG: ABC transporter ATP-binding protein, partial [Spirochaetaceae bacterium]
LIYDLALHCTDGKVTVILGPSGCGKSTILKIIAGLIAQDNGAVYLANKSLNDLIPADRRIGMVFDTYALYPSHDAEMNITSFFFFRKKTPELQTKKKELFERTAELLGVDIKHLLSRRPPTLSGGEQQRVAIGRCITREPNIFLLDEPFGNLDQKLRDEYRVKLKKLLNHFNVTTVYVTHDHREASLLADNLVIMSEGRIEQVGKMLDIYENPANMFVAEFLDLDDDAVAVNLFDADLMEESLPHSIVGVRPEHIVLDLAHNTGSGAASGMRGEITSIRPLPMGGKFHITVQWGDELLHVRQRLVKAPSLGHKVGISFVKYFVFDRETQARKLTMTAQPVG